MAKPDLSRLRACVADAKRAHLPSVNRHLAPLRPLPQDRKARIKALRKARDLLPNAYRRRVVQPLISTLDKRPRQAKKYAEYADELSEAILPHQGDLAEATAAFQEVVADVYDGFLSAEGRRSTKLPDRKVLAPLVKWHAVGGEGPYAYTEDEAWQVQSGFVSLPIPHSVRGLAGWTLLAHETAGHDVLGATDKLIDEMSGKVRDALSGYGSLVTHWTSRLEEAASDVIGVLNMGPAAAVGMIAYFRGMNAALGYPARLDIHEEKLKQDEDPDEHPLQILRGFLVAEVVRLLQFDDAEAWSRAILKEVWKDARVGTIRSLDGRHDLYKAHESAAVVARTVALRELEKLGGHALAEIENWRNKDETKAQNLRRYFVRGARVPRRLSDGNYAAHAVAAAFLEVLDGRDAERTMASMRKVLLRMHAANPAWT